MKKGKLILFLLMSILVAMPCYVFADSIINNHGIEISEEDYNHFLLLYPHEYIMEMEEEKYEKLLTLDFDNMLSTTKFIATTYNPHLQITTEREMTEAEYNNFVPGMQSGTLGGDGTNLSTGSTAYETYAKKITLILLGGNIYNYVSMDATWKYMPNTRSFDVIGYYGYGFSFRNGSQSGNQIYVSNGVYNDITYAWNGTNIKKFSNGFGISMNIVNNSINFLQLIVECDVEPQIDHPSIYASYQHALSSLTLAQSQNYTVGGAGLGNVFIFPYNISQKYDGMSGVSLTY